MATRGLNVVLVGRRVAPLEEVTAQVRSIGGKALVVTGDVAQLNSCKNMVLQAVQHFGALHYAVNNAGVSGENCKLADISLEACGIL